MRRKDVSWRALVAGTLTLGACGVGTVVALGASSSPPAGGGPKSVIVVLKDQGAGGSPAPGNAPARKAAVDRQQAPLQSKVRSGGGTVTHTYQTLNGFSATVSASQAKQLAADPSVAQVIPDARIRMAPLSSGPRAAGAAATPAAALPAGVCPPAGQTFPNTEAISAVKADTAKATGAGVTVAYFAEGIDTQNPDFQRGGQSIFTDYQDFSGDGTAAPTSGGEAFLDATSIAAQGNVTYDLHDLNPAVPKGCTTHIKGTAPGASLVGIKVFDQSGFASDSAIIAGEDYAISHDHVDVVNLSLGSDIVPDVAALDALKVFNAQAVAAGVTVTISSGDQGPSNTVGTPAGEPGVITLGASTTFRDYLQTGYAASSLAKGWLSNELSGLSSAGFTQSGRVVDLLAPGDSTLLVCTADADMYADCTKPDGSASNAAVFGGTSESAPLTAGAAADVIEAYRTTHGGKSPTPALVKQLIVGSATDLGMPGSEQGAGLLNVDAAVKAARSVQTGDGAGAPETSGITTSDGQVNVAETAGTHTSRTVTVTNTSAATQQVGASTRTQSGPTLLKGGTVALDPATDPTVTTYRGPRAYKKVALAVPAGRSRLDVRLTWPNADSEVEVALLDPSGRYAAYSRSQPGIGYAAATAHNPQAGTWTAIVFTPTDDTGFGGDVQYQATTATRAAGPTPSPSTLTLAPGASAPVQVPLDVPTAPGDSDVDLVLHSGATQSDTAVPITIRSLVPTAADGGTFSGSLVAGNGLGEVDTIAFDVPAGKPSVGVGVKFANADELVTGALVDPDGNAVSLTTNAQSDQDGPTTTDSLYAAHAQPKAGRWRLVLAYQEPASGLHLGLDYTGALDFAGPKITADGLPNDAATLLPAGKPVTAKVRVTNTTGSTLPLVLDPRTATASDQALTAQGPASDLAIPDSTLLVPYIVPPSTTGLHAAATATQDVSLDMNGPLGDPVLVSPTIGKSVAIDYSADELTSGTWALGPNSRETGGFGANPAPAGTASTTLTAHTPGFDKTVDTLTGDPWLAAVDDKADPAHPLSLAPGKSVDLEVTITPKGADGTKVGGVLNVGTYNVGTESGDILAALPYSYTIGTPQTSTMPTNPSTTPTPPTNPPATPQTPSAPAQPASPATPPTPQAAVAALLKAPLTRTGSLGIRDLLRFGAVTELFTPPSAGTLHISWKAAGPKGKQRITLATATKTFTAGSTTPVKVRVHLSKTGRARLKHATRIAFSEEVTFSAPSGRTASTVARVLKRG